MRLKKKTMMFTYNNFGQIQIGRELYQHDVVLNNKTVERRQKKKSKPLRAQFGHTPLGPRENIPWDCAELVIGTGYYGRLPVIEAVIHEAEQRGVTLKIMKTVEACKYLSESITDANAVLQVTC